MVQMATTQRTDLLEELDESHEIANETQCDSCFEKCLFETAAIDNLSGILNGAPVHSIGSFKLFGLPTPRRGEVLGIIGEDGIGKSIILQILCGYLKPNLGRVQNPPAWAEVLEFFHDPELRDYLNNIHEKKFLIGFKLQTIGFFRIKYNHIIRPIREYFYGRSNLVNVDNIVKLLDLERFFGRNMADLSMGEVQLLLCARMCTKRGDVYFFDEPSMFLDIKQRLNVAKAIRSLIHPATRILVADSDLCFLEFLSDFICCVYGVPATYGTITVPFSVRDGINIFVDGHLPTENLQFRENLPSVSGLTCEEEKSSDCKEYPNMTKTRGNFKLSVEAGSFTQGEIIVLLGENGTGKTTFMELLAGLLQPDEGQGKVPELNVCYKPHEIEQKWDPDRWTGTVRTLLQAKIGDTFTNSQFENDVVKPLKIDTIIDCRMKCLTMGQACNVALTICLGKVADVYLIDEPFSLMDCNQRLVAARVIKSFIFHKKKTAFIAEHDFYTATYLADRIIVFEGQPSRETVAKSPQPLLPGLNRFVESLGITCRQDSNYRPHMNKENTPEDVEQKRSGRYFFVED